MAQGDDVLLQTPYIICNNKMYDDLEQLAMIHGRWSILTTLLKTGSQKPRGCSD